MAGTVRQVVALGVTIAFAIVAGGQRSLSNGVGRTESGMQLNGKKLFEKETFGGNGRTCQTCHLKHTGTSLWRTFSRSSTRPIPTTRF